MPLRPTELCAICRGAATGRCPGCRAPTCPSHVYSPDGACEACALRSFTATSRVGRNLVLAGALLAGLAGLTNGLGAVPR